MKCFVCLKELNLGYLCEDHANELNHMLDNSKNVVANPDWRHHCSICGAYKDRIVIEMPSAGYFCDKDIREEYERYKARR